MKLRSQIAFMLALFLFTFALNSCSPLTSESEKPTAEAAKTESPDATPPSLPVQYQKPAYMVESSSKDQLEGKDDATLKVGARISSTKKVALREIMKPLASQKKLNMSWASDVNQDILVDVDIQANDDFYKAIENLLRQVDYYYELQGNTIIIKYRETKQFQIAMPFTKQQFSTGTGGNVLGGDIGGDTVAKNVEGTIKLVSEKNEFDIWENIKLNLDSMLEIWSFRREQEMVDKTASKSGEPEGARSFSKDSKDKSQLDDKTDKKDQKTDEKVAQLSGGKGFYHIDKPVGLITVTAPRPLLEKIEAYINSLQKEIYKQISIEAKIIEVLLTDNSSIGINWTKVLQNFQINGDIAFGAQSTGNGVTTVGQVWPYVFSNDRDGKWNDGTNHGSGYDPTRLVSNIRINTANFDLFLNALKTQGNTRVLSNPKISTLNGQPALITVGQNITYIDKIEADVNDETGVITYSAETARVLSGVGLALTATILNNNEIVMNLVPVTSELEGEIEYKSIGLGEIGLPVVNVREMSTIVRVKDGEMLVIGGLISDVNTTDGNFAPVVGDVPVLKYLFGHEEKIKQKRELIILLKPRII